jgi:hypothetical protein
MRMVRDNTAAVRLADGRVLVAGGERNGIDLAAALVTLAPKQLTTAA